ncbi:pre-rRNA-processing protein TSR2 homolog [Papaver somniferum]|uniref:pre-rRNA-processing protein TSR2 homolog n=1 Tax=Papaver somniferum TaxID=3469 RepID=UPI000E7043F9|nr:pre-rRNA-processing protein TSR2 homolog [Papaver somniferum]
MDSGSRDGNNKLALVEEGIYLILSQWTALQLALQYRNYDRFYCQKSDQLRADIFSWFTHSKELYIDDLENILKESMSESFDTELDDGSIGEVALHLMIMHEECLQGKCGSIEKLRTSSNGSTAVSQSKLF